MSPGDARAAGPIVERMVCVDGRRVNVLECDGGGSVIVLVHGLGLAASCWRPHLDRLAAEGFRVLAPDLPGFGGSEGPRSGYHVAEMQEWLERFADVEVLPPAAWVGHSHSCQLLLGLARRRAEAVTALVLAAPTGQSYGIRRVGGQLIGLAAEAFQERPRVIAGVLGRYVRAPIATLRTWLEARHHRPETDAAATRAPVLMVMGESDPIVDVRFARHLARRIPDARLRIIHDAAHAVALDPAREFCDLVTGFLHRVQGRDHRGRSGHPGSELTWGQVRRAPSGRTS